MPPQRGATRKQPQHRVYEPGKRHMELIASVSRSSGLEKGGDALRDTKIQEEYRTFIQGKLDDYWNKYPPRSVRKTAGEDVASVRHRREMEENLLILFRKLREGLLSIKRRDAFALEVYETSLHLSVLFKSPMQTTSTLSHLFPDLYISDVKTASSPLSATPTSRSDTARPPLRPPRATLGSKSDFSTQTPVGPDATVPGSALSTTLISLLHHLAASYPSQIAFYTQLRQLHPSLQLALRAPASSPRPGSAASQNLNPNSNPNSNPASFSTPPTAASPSSQRASHASARDWLLDLARCLRARNYARLDGLTHREAFGRFLVPSGSGANGDNHDDGHRIGAISSSIDCESEHGWSLALEAVEVLVEALLERARGASWDVIRTAYREVSLRATPQGALADVTSTGCEWLARSLVLRFHGAAPGAGRNVRPQTEVGVVGGGHCTEVEAWLDERCGKGEARRKEGENTDGRWVLVKA